MSKLRNNKPRLTAKPLRLAPVSWRAEKGNANARGYGHRWRVYRLEYLAAHPLCVMCAERGLVVLATVVDHIRPHRGDERLFWDASNHQGLCAHCHSSRKQRAERAGLEK